MNFEKPGKSDFWKMKKFAGHTILHMCTKNQSHEVQFLRSELRQDFLSFWVFLCPFNPLPSPLTIQKTKILKRKNHLEMSSFYTSTTKNTIIWCMLTQIWSAHIIFCHFRPFFVLLAHYRPWKLKFWKNVKKHQEISFYTCVPLIRIICTPDMAPVWFLRYEVQQTESLWIVLKISKIKKNP